MNIKKGLKNNMSNKDLKRLLTLTPKKCVLTLKWYTQQDSYINDDYDYENCSHLLKKIENRPIKNHKITFQENLYDVKIMICKRKIIYEKNAIIYTIDKPIYEKIEFIY